MEQVAGLFLTEQHKACGWIYFHKILQNVETEKQQNSMDLLHPALISPDILSSQEGGSGGRI